MILNFYARLCSSVFFHFSDLPTSFLFISSKNVALSPREACIVKTGQGGEGLLYKKAFIFFLRSFLGVFGVGGRAAGGRGGAESGRGGRAGGDDGGGDDAIPLGSAPPKKKWKKKIWSSAGRRWPLLTPIL